MLKFIFFIFAILLLFTGTFARPQSDDDILKPEDIEIKFVYEGPDQGEPVKLDQDFLKQLSDKIKSQIIEIKNNKNE